MNSLSLLIYAVELITNLSTYVGWLFALSIVYVIISTIVRFLVNFDSTINAKPETIAGVRWWHNLGISVMVASFVLNVFLPSRQTAIMMAASEVSEVVLKSETAQNVMKDVTGLSSDAVGLLKNYIQLETKKISDELKPKETKKDVKTDAQPDKT